MNYPILQTLGLLPKEVEVYEILLKLGESPISSVLKETNDHPQIIYRAIDGLVTKDLVLVSYRQHRRYVRAEDPRILEKIEEKRLEKVRSLIPELLTLQKSSKDALVRVAKGNEAVRTLRQRGVDELASGEVYYVIGASSDRFYEVMGNLYPKIEKKRVKNEIIKKVITFENQRESLRDHETNPKYTEFRYLPESYPIPSSTNIFGSTVAIIIWEPEPILITIESAQVAESYKHYFDALWNLAKS